jgi:hypothetical protein
VTPNDCAQCHEKESKEFQASHHAKAGDILGSLDNFLGEVVEGPPAAISGCKQCHGSIVRILPDGKIDPTTWPNTGIGRINPDGSKGACTACHSRHLFSVKVARSPESCGKCHLGPDHPQKEIYDESKHGIAFYANRERMNLESRSWVLGQDYTAAPTCSTCHLSATPDLPVTHDPGERISWTLRPAISKKLENWERKRETMKKVCGNCHNRKFSDAFFTQYDITVELYNEKFAKPAVELMGKLRKAGKITPTQASAGLDRLHPRPGSAQVEEGDQQGGAGQDAEILRGAVREVAGTDPGYRNGRRRGSKRKAPPPEFLSGFFPGSKRGLPPTDRTPVRPSPPEREKQKHSHRGASYMRGSKP